MIGLQTEVRFLKGVGPRRARNLFNLGIEKIEDLIFYYPRTYRDFSEITKINDIKINQKAALKVKVQRIKNRSTRRRRFTITEALVADKTGFLKVIWFNQPYLLKNIKEEDVVLLAGNLELEKELVLKNPEYEVVKDEHYEFKHLGRISPVYRESAHITSRWLRYLLEQVLKEVKIDDYLPEEIKKSQNFIDLQKALLNIHFPINQKSLFEAKKRLAFDEIFIPQLSTLKARNILKKEKSPSIRVDINEARRLKNSLPFKLTESQRKAIWQITKDIKGKSPMNRLLEGDVGSGKTIVATFVLLLIAKAGYQGVLMVPTEILAREHFLKIKEFLKNFGVKIELLTRTTKTKQKKEIFGNLKKGKTDILIGTHALLVEKLEFKNLALAVIDEQHRFGVKQRKALKGKNKKVTPHLLSMTATPIPRTFTLTIYGDLDISVLSEMPKGERKVKTFLVPKEKRLKAYVFIKDHIKKGEQALVVCPTILKSDKLGIKAAEEEYEKLSKSIFKSFKIGLLHGKIKPEIKQKIMDDFRDGKIKMLISTSVVEVGIDIPNITIMMVENADRFGLAQLHQLRGRVGRAGGEASFMLFTDSQNPLTKERLCKFTKIKDGFKLAEYDLSLRGPGEVFGIKQSGFKDLKLVSFTDYDLIKKAKGEAETIIRKDPEFKNHSKLKEKIDKLQEVVHLE